MAITCHLFVITEAWNVVILFDAGKPKAIVCVSPYIQYRCGTALTIER